jgi:hypothetical protein
MVLGTGEVVAFEETTRFGQALDVLELGAVASPKIIGGTLNQLREAVKTDDEFRFEPDKPFLSWERRKGH